LIHILDKEIPFNSLKIDEWDGIVNSDIAQAESGRLKNEHESIYISDEADDAHSSLRIFSRQH